MSRMGRQGADVRVFEGGDGAGFVIEALAEAGGGDLDCHAAVETSVMGSVDLAHARRIS